MKIRSYSELITIPTFIERFRYLKLDGIVGESTFGYRRYLNQVFYNSKKWKDIRDKIIVRDLGCDLGSLDNEIHSIIIIHHMNPVPKDFNEQDLALVLNPEFLICSSSNTHKALHFGDEKLLQSEPITRRMNDTIPWI